MNDDVVGARPDNDLVDKGSTSVTTEPPPVQRVVSSNEAIHGPVSSSKYTKNSIHMQKCSNVILAMK